MSVIRDQVDILRLKASGRHLAQIMSGLADQVAVGITPSQLDISARAAINKIGGRPAFLNYQPPGSNLAYPAALCVSVNEAIVHGLPKDEPLKAGDVVSLDLGLELDGLITDMAITIALPPVEPQVAKLLATTKMALAAGIKAASPGGHIGDIGSAIAAKVTKTPFGLIRDLAGHGVGFKVHEPPTVPNFGQPDQGPKLIPGLVLAIEPMAALGTSQIKLLPDGFTFITKDGSISAHFEHTVLITDTGVEIITQVN